MVRSFRFYFTSPSSTKKFLSFLYFTPLGEKWERTFFYRKKVWRDKHASRLSCQGLKILPSLSYKTIFRNWSIFQQKALSIFWDCLKIWRVPCVKKASETCVFRGLSRSRRRELSVKDIRNIFFSIWVFNDSRFRCQLREEERIFLIMPTSAGFRFFFFFFWLSPRAKVNPRKVEKTDECERFSSAVVHRHSHKYQPPPFHKTNKAILKVSKKNS